MQPLCREELLTPMLPFSKTASARNISLTLTFLFACALCYGQASGSSAGQKDKKAVSGEQAGAPLLTRTTTRHENRRFGYGGTLTLLGPPNGSITIEAWQRNEVDITAEIELRAPTEEDLTQLAAVNSFVLDEEMNHLRILSTGTHDKQFMKRAARNFPKKLLGLPWKIDYRIRVPAYTDLEINAGNGPLTLTGVEGNIRILALESNANLTLAGGHVTATVTRGTVNVRLTNRSWRGAGADIKLASGDMTVELPAGLSLDINADVLRTGQIENSYAGIEARDRAQLTVRSIRGRAGAGGPTIAFTVADGTLRIKQLKETE